jgi:hypothetical protein
MLHIFRFPRRFFGSMHHISVLLLASTTCMHLSGDRSEPLSNNAAPIEYKQWNSSKVSTYGPPQKISEASGGKALVDVLEDNSAPVYTAFQSVHILEYLQTASMQDSTSMSDEKHLQNVK